MQRSTAQTPIALSVGAALACLLAVPAQAAAPTPAQKKALASCTICHDISPAKKKMVGPPLFGVYGKKPTITGVPLKTWDATSLDKWIANPQAIKKGTTMTFSVPDAKQRKDVIEALKGLK